MGFITLKTHIFFRQLMGVNITVAMCRYATVSP